MADRWLYPPCPACRQMRWHVRQHRDTTELQVVCAACDTVALTTGVPEAIKQAQAVRQGQAPAPSGGPWRP